LRFQPTKRPQVAAQKAKAKAVAAKFVQPPGSINKASSGAAPSLPVESSTHSQQDGAAHPATTQQPAAARTRAEDWIATAEDDEYFTMFREKQARGGRKKRKKNKEVAEVVQDWDDIYDPSRPNSYEEYKHSEEKIREVREWKDLLYRHRMKRRQSSDYDSDRSEKRPMNSKCSKTFTSDLLLTSA